MTLFLWDASDFDWARGPMNLAAAAADGIVGFTHKATEATWIKHGHTGEALARARDAGLEFIGAYHVVRSTSPAEQVDYFLSYLDQVAPWWRDFPGFFHQVDLELWSYDRVTAATGKAFAEQLAAAQPKRVVMYASRGQYGDQLATLSPDIPLWNAAYGLNPVAHYPDAYRGDASLNWRPYSGREPVFWQYGSQLTIGTQPGADCNAFRGSLADLRELITGSREGENDMSVLKRDPSTGAVWISNYVTRRHVTSPGEWTFLRTAPGVTDLGDLAAGESIDWFGVDVASSVTAPTHDELVQAAFEGAQRAERE